MRDKLNNQNWFLALAHHWRQSPDTQQGQALSLQWQTTCDRLDHMKYLLTVIAGCGLFFLLSNWPFKKPTSLGVSKGRLSSCPETPNCVSSQSIDKQHAIAPFMVDGPSEQVMAQLVIAIESMKGSRIVRNDGPYIHAEYTSRFWEFVDDLECYYDKAAHIVHVRSSSRLGTTDFGVNRKRVEQLRALFDSGTLETKTSNNN